MFETVYTMTDWYDGPRRGVASVNGKPHVYESCWSNIGSVVKDTFLLSKIPEETLALAMEDWDIWLRWEQAFKCGETTQETHPCLPAERPRHEELEALLTSSLVVVESKAFAATAEFRYNDARFNSAPPMEAEWTRVVFEPSMDQRAKYRSHG